VNRISNPTTPLAGGQVGVTPEQREALVAALEAGFYEAPQGATMAEVADTIGISQQALSERLRRAHGNLLSNVLTVEELEADEPRKLPRRSVGWPRRTRTHTGGEGTPVVAVRSQ
jgi:hypothetical protein